MAAKASPSFDGRASAPRRARPRCSRPFAEPRSVAGYFIAQTKRSKKRSSGQAHPATSARPRRRLSCDRSTTRRLHRRPEREAGGWRDLEAPRALLRTLPRAEMGARYVALPQGRQEHRTGYASEKSGAKWARDAGDGRENCLISGDVKPTRSREDQTRQGQGTVVDGPFTEAKEIIAGFTMFAPRQPKRSSGAPLLARSHGRHRHRQGEIEVRRVSRPMRAQ